MVATSGRPGPVVLGLPEDVLREETDAPVLLPFDRGETVPSAETLNRVRGMLESADRPLILVGGAGWTSAASEAATRFAKDNHIALATVFRYQDAVDNELETYVGDVGLGINPSLLALLQEADLVLAIGPRLDDATTGTYERLIAPTPHQTLVHVHQGSEEIGRVYRPTLGVTASIPAFIGALAELSRCAHAHGPTGSTRLVKSTWTGGHPTRRIRTEDSSI